MVWSTRRSAFAVPGTLLSLLLVWSTDGSSPVAPALAAVPVPVGVVLNLASAMDRRSLTCISVALDDFYLKHPSYTTRVELRVSDSRGDLVAAAYAAKELMDKNAQVKAIILPQTSPEVELFASIAERYSIPILSSSTDAPSWSPPESRFFVRTAPNISSQVAPIAAILEAFAWPAAILLHEDSPYGIAILPSLVHAFRGSCTLRDIVAMPSGATDGHIRETLLAVKNSLTRVYIVHMLPALAARLFHRAMAAGMMSEGYVWITTSGVGNAADNLNPGIIDNMQGVVSLRPHVHATDQARNFSRRLDLLRQESTASNDAAHDDPSALVSLLWLYDTAWAAAAAAEVSFQTTQSKTFLDALLVTKFDGLAGRFELVDGQWQVSAYEIVNIIGKGTWTVGFWTPELGISSSLYPNPNSARKELKQILWPGETANVPIGFGRSESRNRSPLRVGLPLGNIDFIQSWNSSEGPNNNTQRVTGYCIDVFQAVMAKLNYKLGYTYTYVFDESYDKLVNRVHEGEVDALVGDVTITASRMKLVAFSMPFADPGWSMIVAEDSNNSMWIFVKPLTLELWITSLAFFFFTGFVVWLIEHRINPRFRGTPWKQFGVLFYFAFSTMVFSHKEKLESNLSKLVVIMWVFVVLILTTSYTANLTSMLTVRQLQPAISDLREEDYVGVQEGSFLEGTLRDMGFDEKRLKRYSSIDQYADALNKGSCNGGVTAIFDEVPYLRFFLSRYCNGYSMVGPVYKSGGFGFAFPMGSPLALDVSRAILELAGEEKLARIEDRYFNRPGSCVGRSDSAYARLGLQRLGGLFLTNAIVASGGYRPQAPRAQAWGVRPKFCLYSSYLLCISATVYEGGPGRPVGLAPPLIVACLALVIHLCTFAFQERARSELEHTEPAGAGALLWLRAWLRRFDAFDGPRGEPVSNGPNAEESNHLEQELAVGATYQQGAMRDSNLVDSKDSEENAVRTAASEEIVAPVGGHSIGQSVDEPARVVSM